MTPIFVIIATSLKRTYWLINRSLASVYRQTHVDKTKIAVLVVDDNADETEFDTIKTQMNQLRQVLQLDANDFCTQVIRNARTRFMSGTGAWNTGILEAHRANSMSFVAILDDDDEFLPHHLSDCLAAISPKTIAVFQRLFWKNEDGSEMYLPFVLQDLVAENFFIGNPGIQGSNMFFKTECLLAIHAFDENLPNTTDRDLMIRFLEHFDAYRTKNPLAIQVIESLGVIHYNHKHEKVNNHFAKKHKGLDLFYQKYRPFFSEAAYQKSLIRAQRFFHYTPIECR